MKVMHTTSSLSVCTCCSAAVAMLREQPPPQTPHAAHAVLPSATSRDQLHDCDLA